MAHSYREDEQKKEARKLRELFKGRFSDDESLELLKEYDSLSDAVDFILNSNPDEVRRFIHDRNEALVDTLRNDSSYIHQALTHGVEASIRLFACQGCDHYWWRKVPARKEVSKCNRCRTRYDPVPRDQEWGLAEFACECGNVFWGSGWMNHTQSPCYSCLGLASPTRIVPPTRPRQQKKRTKHSCTGTNCYNRAVPLGPHGPAPTVPDGGGASGRRGAFNLCTDHRQVCPHQKSARQRKVLYPSSPHVSTGSTVNTFMSQGELAEDYEDLEHLPNVPEVDNY